MPIVEVNIRDGDVSDANSGLRPLSTPTIRFTVPASAEPMSVVLHGGAADPGAEATRIVMDYLELVGARRMLEAQRLLADDFEMVFPGTASLKTLEALMEWAAPRYRSISKTFEAVEAFGDAEAAVVYTRGWLAGIWPDGTSFEGIRFIDRFEIKAGKITRQDVWNDLAEVRIL